MDFDFVKPEVENKDTKEIKKCRCGKEIYHPKHVLCKDCWMKFVQPQFDKNR